MSQIENPLAKTSFAYQRRFASGSLGRLVRRLPRPLLLQLKRLLLLPLDGADLLLGLRGELVPPRYLRFAGDGDFVATGEEFLRYFAEFGGLRPEHNVLDVGCGIGRMARPLTRYLTTGSYEGIDIVPRGIHWCVRNISSRYPNFHFQLADIQNQMYNPHGRNLPAQYEFPFEDCHFDFAYLTSVFTHMLKQDMERYLEQIARTLRFGGRCFVTFFLRNDESRRLMSAGLSSLDFPFSWDGCWLHSERLPEHAVAFDEEYIRDLYRQFGFTLETIRYGAWCGRTDYLSYQDIVVAKKN
jgi:SAM-dependent methyltransferase